MKNILTIALLFLMGTSYAQIETPAASPFAKGEQMVGLTTVSFEYSRPGVKGRTIFAADGLVPFGEMWRTGANAATKIGFSSDVTINGEALPAGDYAVLTIPGAEKWTVNFYPYEARGFGSYVEQDPALSVMAESKKLDWTLENFTISVHNLSNDGAHLVFAWDDTKVALDLGVNTDDAVMANIESVMAGPSAGDYYAAASYYHTSGKDLNKALKWITKATSGDNPMFWQVRTKALILKDLGKTQEAIEAAKMSMELAKKAGNGDYVRMNEKSIAEWKNM